MSYWADATLIEALQEAERYVCTKVPCVVDRYCLDIVEGQGLYNIPDYISEIRGITWKGEPLDPAAFHNVISDNSAPYSIPTGKPREYVADGYGNNNIRLFPPPNETLTRVTTGLWDTSILTKCIIEFYRMPDVNSFTKRIPSDIRDLVTFPYALSQLFRREGIYQDVVAAEYYAQQSAHVIELYRELIKILYAAWPKVLADSSMRQRAPRLAKGMLPARFYDV